MFFGVCPSTPKPEPYTTVFIVGAKFWGEIACTYYDFFLVYVDIPLEFGFLKEVEKSKF